MQDLPCDSQSLGLLKVRIEIVPNRGWLGLGRRQLERVIENIGLFVDGKLLTLSVRLGARLTARVGTRAIDMQYCTIPSQGTSPNGMLAAILTGTVHSAGVLTPLQCALD